MIAPFFANPDQQKVFHAAEYDLICLRRDYGFAVTNIFDTMSAGRTLGWPQVGLAAVLDTHFGVTLDKSTSVRIGNAVRLRPNSWITPGSIPTIWSRCATSSSRR